MSESGGRFLLMPVEAADAAFVDSPGAALLLSRLYHTRSYRTGKSVLDIGEEAISVGRHRNSIGNWWRELRRINKLLGMPFFDDHKIERHGYEGLALFLKLPKIVMPPDCIQQETDEVRQPEVKSYDAIRQARLRAGGPRASKQQWQELKAAYGNRCLACNRPEAETGKLQRDHVVPLAKRGSNAIDNLQPLCGPCNRRKWARIVDYRPHIANMDPVETGETINLSHQSRIVPGQHIMTSRPKRMRAHRVRRAAGKLSVSPILSLIQNGVHYG